MMTAVEVFVLIRSNSKRFYVYTLHRPDGRPFYVGIGTGRRLLDHDLYARRQPNWHSYKLSIIRKILSEGGAVSYSIHEWCDCRAAAEVSETALIKQLGRADLGTGSLANNTSGGEGASALSPEAIARMGARLKSTWSQRDKKLATEHLNDPDVRARAAASRVGQKRGPYTPRNPNWVTDSFRAVQRARILADPISRRPGVAAKMSAAKLGKPVQNHWTKDPLRKAKITRGAHPRARPVEIDGKTFACKQDVVDGLHVCLSTVDHWLKRGRHGARYLPK